jgi:UDP-2-acetamido-3-amino-2,3-dideoxy-glucuronate N-acetyltransferase
VSDVFVHSQGICESQNVGAGTRIWAFTHVLPGARIGRDCNICDGVFIENDVVVGDFVTIKSGVQLWDGIRLGNSVFVGPNATFTNDIFPRSKRHLPSFPLTVVESGASVGANATILPGVRIGAGAMIGAGAVVIEDVPVKAVVVGNPARIVGYAGAVEVDAETGGKVLADESPVRLIRLVSHADKRGRLAVADGELPFLPKRVFLVDQVPVGSARGSHAHRTCHQLMIAIAGEVTVSVDDGKKAFAVALARPDVALHVPPLVWSLQYKHRSDTVLLVLASDGYDRDDYISDYSEIVGP